MKGRLQHAGHWHDMHPAHSHHFWLYLLIACTVISLTVLLIGISSGKIGNAALQVPPYYPYTF